MLTPERASVGVVRIVVHINRCINVGLAQNSDLNRIVLISNENLTTTPIFLKSKDK